MFSVRGKSGKILAEAVLGMSEFRTDHGMPIRKIGNIPINKTLLAFIRRDPWEIPPPVFCPPASEIAVANLVGAD